MRNGKKICEHLKVVRKQIADANDIPYEITECTHQGPCAGTCPKCESELRYIENQLSLRRAAGKAVSLVGLSLGISSAFMTTGCTSVPNNPEIIEQSAPSDPSETIQGMMLPPSDTTSQTAVGDSEEVYEDNYIEIDGDIVMVDPCEEATLGMIANTPAEEVDIDSMTCYTVVDIVPEFPGGEPALMNYIRQNIRYQEFAAECCIQGRVYLSFIVERDGSISNIEVLRSPAEELSKEAIRIVQSMPKWKPGEIKDTPVRTKYVLPVTFKLE
ncbi:MAG: energy transducer TonB [Bacteroidales bacterium]|nr:energy transducer TonB [Bacteroidales bacterium]